MAPVGFLRSRTQLVLCMFFLLPVGPFEIKTDLRVRRLGREKKG